MILPFCLDALSLFLSLPPDWLAGWRREYDGVTTVHWFNFPVWNQPQGEAFLKRLDSTDPTAYVSHVAAHL